MSRTIFTFCQEFLLTECKNARMMRLMNPFIQSHRAHVINLCHGVVDACSVTDITVLQTQARLILKEMGMEEPEPKAKPKDEDDWRELL